MSTYVRTATLLVRVNTGAPTWWAPNIKLIRHGDGLVQLRSTPHSARAFSSVSAPSATLTRRPHE